ncbi:aldo-keto reductase family 1 member A1-like [Diorhabda carinulata]|uniref:aldo-keto reductase family 1 member A1-like n=1 Tax=Diorhabda carinulata TaxID=1163345 RepID=UPI0025A0FC5E|nr:aldo-keto reductase family 1 member A1-like [Diorhabda carinulata]
MSVEYQTLPNGFSIPAIGYGTCPPQQGFIEAFEDALETGYRHIDTASFYRCEQIIGRILKKWFSAGKLKREDLFITSKYMPKPGEDQNVEDTMKKTLKELQTDYVDLYLVHLPLSDKENVEIWKKMEQQVDSGRAKYIGLSNFQPQQIDVVLKNCRIRPVCLQNQVHLYAQQKELQEYCKKNDIIIVCYTPLGAPGRENGDLLDIIYNETVKKVAEKYNKFPSQVALRFLIDKHLVPVPKSWNQKRIKENFDVFDFKLSEEDLKILEELDQNKTIGFPPIPSDDKIIK